MRYGVSRFGTLPAHGGLTGPVKERKRVSRNTPYLRGTYFNVSKNPGCSREHSLPARDLHQRISRGLNQRGTLPTCEGLTHVNIIDYVWPGSIEEQVFKAIDTKKDNLQSILKDKELLKQWVRNGQVRGGMVD